MDVLVTGGAGFIGSHIAHRMLERGHRVTVLDDLDPYYDVGIKRRNLDICREAGGNDFTFVEGSVVDRGTVADVVTDADVVYHEAAQAGVRASVEDPLKPNTVNVEGLLNVLLESVEAGVDRVVQASSSSVYGKVEYLPYDEEHPNEPRSPYGVSKLAAEHYARVFSEVYGLPTVNLRYFTVYGPRMRPNMAITNFTSRCLNGEPPVIYGDGEQTRDFTYVEDIVAANETLLDDASADGETMNVGSTGNITINELAEEIIELTGADVEVVYDDAKEADARHTHAAIGKARELIGYEPTVTIREGLDRFVDWYRANRDWYEPLVEAS